MRARLFSYILYIPLHTGFYDNFNVYVAVYALRKVLLVRERGENFRLSLSQRGAGTVGFMDV